MTNIQKISDNEKIWSDRNIIQELFFNFVNGLGYAHSATYQFQKKRYAYLGTWERRKFTQYKSRLA